MVPKGGLYRVYSYTTANSYQDQNYDSTYRDDVEQPLLLRTIRVALHSINRVDEYSMRTKTSPSGNSYPYLVNIVLHIVRFTSGQPRINSSALWHVYLNHNVSALEAQIR